MSSCYGMYTEEGDDAVSDAISFVMGEFEAKRVKLDAWEILEEIENYVIATGEYYEDSDSEDYEYDEGYEKSDGEEEGLLFKFQILRNGFRNDDSEDDDDEDHNYFNRYHSDEEDSNYDDDDEEEDEDDDDDEDDTEEEEDNELLYQYQISISNNAKQMHVESGISADINIQEDDDKQDKEVLNHDRSQKHSNKEEEEAIKQEIEEDFHKRKRSIDVQNEKPSKIVKNI